MPLNIYRYEEVHPNKWHHADLSGGTLWEAIFIRETRIGLLLGSALSHTPSSFSASSLWVVG